MKQVFYKAPFYKATWCRQILAHVLVAFLVIPPPLFAKQEANPEPGIERIRKSLEQEVLRLNGDLSSDGILDKFNYDALEIIDYVSNDIAFQPYSGILRGVNGTLTSRAGNAHDQALTLTDLLRSAGFDAQILKTTLSEAQAEALVKHAMINTPRKVVETYAVPEFLQPVVQRLKRESRELTTLAAETNVVADRLLNTLDTKWLESSVVSIMAQATSASLSYRWVRWRTSSGQPWAQVHPASDIAQTWNLQASSIETQEIDSSVCIS